MVAPPGGVTGGVSESRRLFNVCSKRVHPATADVGDPGDAEAERRPSGQPVRRTENYYLAESSVPGVVPHDPTRLGAHMWT